MTYHRCGLRIVLGNLFRDLDEAEKMFGFGCVMFERIRVEHGDARRPRVEVNRVAAVMNDGIAVVIV